ncbi:MAG: Nif3-like dinuclear metal center hexameric protein, partial [Candidatus Cloacimonetes bacterium]|nr:Nif3-like dinuclear metal center hexameric protein [Candidatus Cloacimonadota bacterium]
QMQISELLARLETKAPASLALEWDNVGLLLGDATRSFQKALITLDVTPNAVHKALEIGADLILSHHPLIFRPLKRFSDPLLLKLAEHRIAVICLHTNLDVAADGVNQALAEKLGLQVTELLSSEQGGKWYHLSVTVPIGHTNKVAEAVFAAGGGRIGNYRSCSARHHVTGTFEAGESAKPFIPGVLGQTRTTVSEEELEFMVNEASLRNVLAAVKNSHPYETPLVYWFPVASPNPGHGLGLIGKLPSSLSLSEITKLVSERLRCPRPRLWTAGVEPRSRISRIAVCGGAGASVLPNAEGRAELFISGDLGYHVLLESGIPVIDAGHFFTEYPVLETLRRWLVGWDLPCEVLPLEEHEYWRQLLEPATIPTAE